ncbi:MAG: hypothetical protein PHS24_01480 [Bacilli bacterium]|nr:hypothetical protein [Bacilli bacterium]
MNKKTLLLFIFSFLIIFVAIFILWNIENKNAKIEFYAVIINVNKQSYLIKPFSSNKLISGYQEISITLNEGLKVGDILKIQAENKILETYPPMVNVISYEVIYSLNNNPPDSTIPLVPQDTPPVVTQ